MVFDGIEYAVGTRIGLTFDDYFFGYDDEQGKHHPGWKELIEELLAKYPLGTL